jgi:signal transduction histidine kinase
MDWVTNGLEKDMNKITIIVACLVIVAAFSILIFLWINMRKQYVAFTIKMCDYLDEIIRNITSAESVEHVFSLYNLQEETLDSKIVLKLKQLSDVTFAAKQTNLEQKKQIQEMVSDISHQLKTPIANITMYNDTILNHNLPEEKRNECLQIVQKQVEKLDFLVKSLMKMSRLENNMITLKKEQNNLYDSISQVLAGVRLHAENKKLMISVKCENPFLLYYDEKWTVEAIFNVIDNAVKYTPECGKIDIVVERLDLFTKVCVKDTGIGISPEHVNDIFKRFVRERKVHKEDGVGIGLYLTREILTKQGGYVKVTSREGEGSMFSLYLPN